MSERTSRTMKALLRIPKPLGPGPKINGVVLLVCAMSAGCASAPASAPTCPLREAEGVPRPENAPVTSRTSATANAAITPSSAPAAATTSASAESSADSDTRGAGIDEELLEEQVEFERQPFDADHVPLTVATPEEFAPGGWRAENSLVIDWDADGVLDIVVQFVEIPRDDRSDALDDRARGLVFAHGEADGLRREALGFFVPSTASGGAMWGGSDLLIDLTASADGRDIVVGWMIGARDRLVFELVFAWDAVKKRLRLARRTVSWGDALDGSHGSDEQDFVTGNRTVSTSPADGAPTVKKSRFSPKWIAVEDARAEE